MNMTNESRHNQLLTAGWIYDASQDRYRAPDSASDGTARLYNQAAAWEQLQADQAERASQPPAPVKGTRQIDPRRKEPE